MKNTGVTMKFNFMFRMITIMASLFLLSCGDTKNYNSPTLTISSTVYNLSLIRCAAGKEGTVMDTIGIAFQDNNGTSTNNTISFRISKNPAAGNTEDLLAVGEKDVYMYITNNWYSGGQYIFSAGYVNSDYIAGVASLVIDSVSLTDTTFQCQGHIDIKQPLSSSQSYVAATGATTTDVYPVQQIYFSCPIDSVINDVQ